MTPEQIDLLKRLQPFFKKMMGEWHHLDSCYCDKLGVGVVMGSFWRVEFHFHRETHYTMEENVGKLSCLRIPKAIDWQNPERGLWGMVHWNNWKIGQNFIPGYLAVISIQKPLKIHSDPFTALLKVLAEQEGV